MQTHNIRKNCRHCSKLIREDLLFKHELVCQTNIKEHECNRFSGVQLMNDYTFHSSVSGCFRTYELNVESGKDYEDILTYTCRQAKLRILDVLQHHPIKAQLIITLNFHRYVVCDDVKENTFRSLCEPILKTDNVDDFLSRAKIYIRHGLETYERMGADGYSTALKVHILILQSIHHYQAVLIFQAR